MTASVLLLGAVSCSEKKAEEPVKKEISVQLYSIRSVIGNPELYAQNHEEAFKALAEMGYTSVEAACCPRSVGEPKVTSERLCWSLKTFSAERK